MYFFLKNHSLFMLRDVFKTSPKGIANLQKNKPVQNIFAKKIGRLFTCRSGLNFRPHICL
ncbi:hypothetical protein CKK33_07625 [Mucilaginibacter sp. MD40]|nr:hypothetical protein CKK33_07625 [Mucilaginibacter sp. MD40]